MQAAFARQQEKEERFDRKRRTRELAKRMRMFRNCLFMSGHWRWVYYAPCKRRLLRYDHAPPASSSTSYSPRSGLPVSSYESAIAPPGVTPRPPETPGPTETVKCYLFGKPFV